MGWLKVAEAAEVPQGRGKMVRPGKFELALFQIDGVFYCIDNRCPHMDGPLAEGDLEGDTVYCPWHFWPINVKSGALNFDPTLCVSTYPAKAEDGAVWIDIDLD